MGFALQLLSYVIAVLLQCLILNAMRMGAWRQYPFLFLYVLVDMLTNLLEAKPNLAHAAGNAAATHDWTMVYWIDEQIIQATLYLLVISLIYRATAGMRQRPALIAGLLLGSILFIAANTLLHYNPDVTLGAWMTRWSRDMNFSAAILDLGLWAVLIRARKKDYRLLMIAGALGLQFTAGAVGLALRDISHATVGFTAVMIPLSNLACLYIWWQTFRLPVRHTAR